MGLIDKTYAIVVAVEEYPGLAPNWALPGVTREAANFVEWLVRDRRLPKPNIQVFVNSTWDFGEVAQAAATADNINNFLTRIGTHWPKGELLLLYWAGHGFVSRDGTRRLFFGDATTTVKSNLDLEQLVQLLRTTARGRFEKQIAIIDTCAKFFETLQSTKGMPRGGLPEGLTQKEGVEQNFYFAASSGQYATQSTFGPRVLDLLRQTPGDEWPPNPRALRNGIEELFDKLVADREAGQQPAWLEYRDGKDNRLERGVLPTLGKIHEVTERAMIPLRYLRSLTKLAADCPSLTTRQGRDALAESLHIAVGMFRPKDTREDTDLDLMSLIAWALEQKAEQPLAAEIVRMEANSTPAYLFEKAISSVSVLREYWPLLAATRLTTGRAQVLFRKANPFWMEQLVPESVEEALEILQSLGTVDSLVEFLLRAAQERAGDASCRALDGWLAGRSEWTAARDLAKARLEKDATMSRYLLVRVEESQGVSRVTRAWLWGADLGEPLELKSQTRDGTLPTDIATLLNEAEQLGGKVHLEMMLPESLFHLEPKQLAWKNRRGERDLEALYPVALRWRERMDTPGDPSFETGRWQQTAKEIENRRGKRAARADWKDLSCDVDAFCSEFRLDQSGELIGIEAVSEGEERYALVTWICSGGLPYAVWPRRRGVDLTSAKAEVSKMLVHHSFEEVPAAKNDYALSDLLLLWDDPKRNPYDRKMKGVRQK